ncbi:hypothetical protein ANAPC5_01139 [Anaplasma phagocytophilum]|nr:hypothetical protein ANAPC2_00151 [Anaplasma phagocytophilum]SBO31222.1 hypothetical protein ANAPC3_00459 [Anaplasma phagocytophilum]SBO32818.1 hypothetical protein ANAPC4_00938 [Anaplasma phagocytophilum]SCV65402.1 hypothetical protein ANAPC5_01139 [Anaplasma phagocytophilum]
MSLFFKLGSKLYLLSCRKIQVILSMIESSKIHYSPTSWHVHEKEMARFSKYLKSNSKKYSDPTEKQSCAALLCQKNFTGAKIRTQNSGEYTRVFHIVS